MVKLLVTGGAGFIGSELVRQLAATGDRVSVVDNLVNGKRANLEGLSGDVSFHATDLRDASAIEVLLEGVEVVFHLACLGVRHSIHAPRENHEVNAGATLSLLEQSRRAGVKRFVHVSSSEVYGTARRLPMDEEHPTFPMTVYGASKLAGECYARAYFETYRFPSVVVRPFNTYGPRSHHEGDSGEVIPKWMLRCMAGRPMVVFGDGKQSRDFLFVEDTARGIAAAATADAALGQTINLASGRDVALLDLAREIASVCGRSETPLVHDIPRPGDVLRLCGDASRARQLLGFEPRVSWGEGLGKLRDWYAAQGSSPEALLEQERVRNWTAPDTEPPRG